MSKYNIGTYFTRSDIFKLSSIAPKISQPCRIIDMIEHGICVYMLQDVFGNIDLILEEDLEGNFKLIQKPDVPWIIHCVFDDNAPEGSKNAHTHGMYWYGHLDFQVVFPANQKTIMYLLNTMGKRVQNGEKFQDGDMVDGIFTDCKVRFMKVRETGRDVLRLIIPDGKNRFPEEAGCDVRYVHQACPMFEE